MSLDKDKMTPALRLRYTRASHNSQYIRYMSYSDALKNSFFPRTIPLWNSLPSSVVASKTTEEFKVLIEVKGPELFSVLVQAGLCRTCSETTLLVFPRGGSNIYTCTPAHPSFTTEMWGVRGYTFHGYVLLMSIRSIETMSVGS